MLNFSYLLTLRDILLIGRGPSSPRSAREGLGFVGCVLAGKIMYSVPLVRCIGKSAT